VLTGEWFWTFQRIIVPSFSGAKQSKKSDCFRLFGCWRWQGYFPSKC